MTCTKLFAYAIAPLLFLLGLAAGIGVSAILGIMADVLVIALLLDGRRKASTHLGSTHSPAETPPHR